ncbi:predicted membrane protein [Moesziomyces antarcticus T-34]|uniref:GDT1 family protein n=1 Tax=Pseudozyma antarctica (strain T-34) TaxID=1151754 RepID=M9M2M3_PSEA3|nr:predicted membrane protein [Moesziomyces antarcticus T-34]
MEAVAAADTALNNATSLGLGMVMGGSESGVIPGTLSSYTTALGLSDALQNDPRALWSSFAMIIVSEIGDKTFLIAAILAMRQSRLVVFSGAFASLAVMSVLSALLGVMFPSLLPKSLTNLMAAALFLVFGLKMVRDGLQMSGDELQEEWHEAEREIEEENTHELDSLEQGHTTPSHSATKRAGGMGNTLREGTKNLCGLCFSPVFAQAFILTFLGEWGDRSQIATIALAAAHNVTLVCIGTIAGHACCTSMAVVGGSWLATKISVKHVTLGGATLFLVFAVVYAFEAYSEPGGVLAAENVVQMAKQAAGE